MKYCIVYVYIAIYTTYIERATAVSIQQHSECLYYGKIYGSFQMKCRFEMEYEILHYLQCIIYILLLYLQRQ